MRNTEWVVVDSIMASIYIALMVLSICVHSKLQRGFPLFRKTSQVLCGTIILMCLATISKYLLDALGYLETNRILHLLGNVVLWNIRIFLVIMIYVLHLLFWGQIYEHSTELVLLPTTYANWKLRIIMYVYICVVGVDTVVMTITTIVCKQSVGQWITNITYFTNYFSLAFVTLIFIVYLYKNYNPSLEHPENRRARTIVGFLALACLLLFMIRGVLDLTLFNGKKKVSVFIYLIYWLLVEVIPITSLLCGFFTLPEPAEMKPILS